MDLEHPLVFAVIFLFISFGILFIGLHGLRLNGSQVNAEFINGILTASSILFGFWIILIQRKPRERIEKWRYENIVSKAFFMSFASLIGQVIVIYATAYNIIPSGVALMLCVLGFSFNATFLTMTLYHYKIKGRDVE